MKQDKEFHKIKAKLSWPRNQTFLQRTKHSYNNNNQLHHQAYKIFKTPKWTQPTAAEAKSPTVDLSNLCMWLLMKT